ncbi:MAG: Hydroxyethylthiazole kinase [Syntrophaceae bacterium PtaU1.Bin231]|nr:MAG: Hydroxyethylthiazole kinase [Syntrophaceae bacterium PtaU1.Bin231]
MPGKSKSRWGAVTAELSARIRQEQPLIHHITNFVVMNDTANATLAVGASPVMAHAKEEVADLAAGAGALVLNPGTLEPAWVEAMLAAGKRANRTGVPIIYDPVGVGATPYRSKTGRQFLKTLRFAVIRGNSGEIGALSGFGGAVRGVDSAAGVDDPEHVTAALAKRARTVAVLTGKRDILSDGLRVLGVDNGHPMLQTITGSGCMVTTVIAAFCAVESDFLAAAAAGLAYYGLAAQIAGRKAKGPGSFRTALLDALYLMTPAQIEAGVRITVLR